MHCSKCGTQIPENARFCSKCGSPISDFEKTPKQVKTSKITGKIIRMLILFLVVIVAAIFVFKPIVSKMGGFKGEAKFETKGGFVDTQIIFEADGKYMKVGSKGDLIKCKIIDTYKEDEDIIYELEPIDKASEGQGVPLVSVAARIPQKAKSGKVEGKWGYALLADLGEDGYFASGRVFSLEEDGTFQDTALLNGGEIIEKDGRVETAADMLFNQFITLTDENSAVVYISGYWSDDGGSGYRLEYAGEDREDYIYFTLKP